MKTYKMKINEETYEAKILKYDGSSAKVNVNGVDFYVEIDHNETPATPKLYRSKRHVPDVPKASGAASGDVNAPIPGVIIDIKTSVGTKVKTGDVLLLLEAMKMESEIHAPFDGTIKEIKCQKGESVQEGQALIIMEPDTQQEKPVLERRKEDKLRPVTSPAPAPKKSTTGKNIITSPLPGTVLDIKKNQGDAVSDGDVVIILEAMKMESEVHSEFTGKIKQMFVTKGQSVQEGQELFEVE